MASQLRNMMAEIESWESATEFGIPEELWAGYQVRNRSDDLYIAVLSSVFDTLRIKDSEAKQQSLSELAKTLLIYSRSTASKHLTGVDRTINILYCSAVFYLAGFPATATLLARKVKNFDDISQEEQFLYGLLSRQLNDDNALEEKFLENLSYADDINFEELFSYFKTKIQEGLITDPRLFIVAKLTLDCLTRFEIFNIWDCLQNNAANYSYDIWQPFLVNTNAFPLWELFPSQMTAINSGILSDADEVYSMQMPTSSGKTSLCEIIIYNEVKGRNKKVLFLVPFRALASEIKEGISKRLVNAGVSVVASHGGNIPTKSEGATAETADVLIITPEKFTALAQSLPDLEKSFDTIICDEGHLIDDSSRGLQYELLLTKLKMSDDNNRKIIFISAILPNVDVIHGWLGGASNTLAKSDYKPVEVDFAFITTQSSGSWQLDFNTIFYGDSSERYNWKNPHRKYSKLSKYKIEKILNCFIRDLTITEAFDELSSSRKKEPISKKTIGQKYREMREIFIQGAFTYLELFGGAGAIALIGVPPLDLVDKINNDRNILNEKTKESKVRVRPYKKRGEYDEYEYRKFWFERALREYAWNNLSINQVWVVADFSIVKMIRRNTAGERENFVDYGYEYLAETNWSSGRYDFRLREKELWDKIYSTNKGSLSSYHERMLRDMKWIINRHPLGTRIKIKTRTDYKPSASKFRDARLEWFPDGYER